MPKLPKELPAIMFFAEEHAYITTHNMRKCVSVSSVQRKYTPTFEGEYWRKNKALREVVGEERWKALKAPFNLRGVAKGLPPGQRSEKVLSAIAETLSSEERVRANNCFTALEREWKLKQLIFSRRGTIYHNERENEDIAAGGRPNPVTGVWQPIGIPVDKTYCDNHNLTESLADLPDGYYPELLVYDWALMLMGQLDCCWIWTVPEVVHEGVTYYNVRYVCSLDYKTNADKGPRGKKGKVSFLTGKLEWPFVDVDATKSAGYAIQQGMYTKILERAGFTPWGAIGLEWVEDFDPAKTYIEWLPYYSRELDIICQMREKDVLTGNPTMFEYVN